MIANGGGEKPMLVGHMDGILCRHLGCVDDRVYFDPSYAPKLRFKHRLAAEHFGMMPLTLDLGSALRDGDRALTFIYDDVHVFGRSFHLVIKTTGERHELWVTSFRQIREADKRSRFKRLELIRRHK